MLNGRRARLGTVVAMLWCASIAVCLADDTLLRKLTSIPAGPLGEALQVLARDRDLQVAYAADEVDSITTLGASGELTVDEALTQLLRNTGLTYRHSGANEISILSAVPRKTPAPAKESRPAPRDESGRDASQVSQSGPAPSTAARTALTQGSALQEVRITAQRRSENLQTIPVAVTALPGGALQGKGVSQLSDLQYAVPSLSIGNAGLSNVVNIRGVGLASGSPAVGNGVAVYVDGLFQTPTIYANQFYDIEDVEVLRGPQGTLVGANSTGGAIFINSRNPKLGAVEGYAQAGGGSYDAWSAQGAINLPVNDVLALRVAAELTQHESFYRSTGPAYTDAGSLYDKSVRLGLLLEPGVFKVLGKLEYVDRDTGGYAATPVPGTRYAPFAPSNPFVLDYDTPHNLNHERELTLNLQLRYPFANGIALRSQSGYIDKPVHNFEDYDGTAVNTPLAPRLTYDQHVRGQHLTQEVNLLSPQVGRYEWVAGAYFARSNINVNIYETGALGLQGPAQYIYNPQRKTTTGVFGQINFKLARSLELQTGMRYSTYRVTSNGFISLVLPSLACGDLTLPPAPWNGCKVGSSAGEESDARVTGKVALNYRPTDDNLLYAFAARGYKPGGFNSPTAPFGPETVWDYELGWKSSPLQDHVRTQLGGFLYRYENFQFQQLQLSTGTVGVTNLPTATIDGLEGSLQARVGGWGVDAGVAYVHSRLPSRQPFVNNHLLPPSASNLPQCPAGEPSSASCFDYTPYLADAAGGPSLYAPQWSYNIGVQYEFRLGGDTSLTPRLNYAYVGGQFTSLTYSRVTDYLPAHGLLAAFLSWRLQGNWTIDAFGTNLTNALYRTGEGLNSGNYYFYGAPRQLGVRARYEWR
ncbi:MAG TPA: TonB-dependent receptor [Steroidobacteraceae bacterium]